jgi:hypothetical protein
MFMFIPVYDEFGIFNDDLTLSDPNVEIIGSTNSILVESKNHSQNNQE